MNNTHNSHFRRNKKMHYGSNTSHPTSPPQKSIEILSASNFNGSHCRMPHVAIGGATGAGCSGKNGYYHIHQHHYHTQMAGSGSPINSEHQNLNNLTYVNVDADVSPAVAPATAAVSTAAGMKTLLKPLATTPPPPPPAPPVSRTNTIETPTAATVAATAATNGIKMYLQPPPTLQLNMAALGPGILSSIVLTPEAAATTPTNMISCSQLDEAITAAAANTSSKNLEMSAVMAIHSPSFATLPFMLHQHQQQQQQQQQQQHPQLFQNSKAQQQLFFGYGDGYSNTSSAWSSPCFANAYGPSPSSNSSGSAHSRLQSQRAVSPASSTCSLVSESQWSAHSRLTPSPTATPTPKPLVTVQGSATAQHVGNINGLHAMLPLGIPPPLPPSHNLVLGGGAYPHYCGPNCGCNGSTTSWLASWYELVLPPDRYLDHARNVELTAQPEKLLSHCKYDNLSLDIWKRFYAAQQTHAKFKLKMRLWRYLFIWLNQPMFTRYRICLVGSTITGFGTDTSDIDMCLLPEHPTYPPPHQQHQHQQHHYHNELRAEALMILNLFNAVLKEMAFHDFNLIEARVPILRFKDRINGIEVDLNYNNCVGIKNTYLLQLYAQLDWRTRPLVVIVKLWAQYHDINDAKRMTVSSYSLVLMVLHYLQYACVPRVLPCLQTLYPEKFNLGQQDCLDLDLIEPIEPYQTHNTQTLGEHLLGFFKYYSNFDYRNNAISIRTGGILPVTTCRLAKSPKNDIHQWKELNIEEPFDLSNTARSVYDCATFERVKATFVTSARRLEHTLDLASIFTPIHHTQRLPLPQPAMHPHSQAPHVHHPHQSHPHLMHARNAAPNAPSKMATSGNFAPGAAAHLI